MENLRSARQLNSSQVSNAEAVDRWMGDAVTPDPSDSPPTNTAAVEVDTGSGTGSRTGVDTGTGTGSGTGSGSGTGGDNSNNSGPDSPRGAERASPKTNGSSDSSNPRHVAEPEEGSNLFVSGLTPTVDDAVLYATFARFGAVISAKVMLRVSTGVSRGFGFVLFQTAAQAQAALEATQGTAIKGHGGRLQVSVSKHRGENLVAESRVVYLRNVPTGVFEDAARFEGFLAAFGKMERCVLRSGCTSALTHVIVTFDSVSAARKCVAGSHGKTPFPECGVALMAKMEEPQSLREQRLSQRHAGNTGPSGSDGSLTAPCTPFVAEYSRPRPEPSRHAQQPVYPPDPFLHGQPPMMPGWPSSGPTTIGFAPGSGFMPPPGPGYGAPMPPAFGMPPFGMPPFPGGPPMWAPGGLAPPTMPPMLQSPSPVFPPLPWGGSYTPAPPAPSSHYSYQR